MDKHTKKTPSLFRYPVLVAFGLFFIGLFVLDMATPDRAYSELENTTLTQRPRLTAVSADGLNNYFTSYTRYVKDQVFGRDQWISLQSAAETTLFQKTQSGGILLGREHMMFARHYSILKNEEKGMAKNLAAVQSLAQRYPGRVNLMLVPSASVVYPENIPAGAPQIDEKSILEGVAAQGEAYGRFIDVLPALTEHKGEYLYYRTDHHWTTLGAYYAYQQFCETLGLTHFDRDAHTAETCEDFYGTHYSKARAWNAEPDTITWYDLQNSLTVWNVTGPGQPTEGTTTGLYDLDKLEVGDTFRITVLDKAFIYEVDQIKTVLPVDVSELLIDEEKELCTLVTCTPYGINSHRLLVRGHRIESEDMRSFWPISDAFIIDRLIVTPVVAMPIILLLILYVCFKPAKRKLPINDEGELI